MGIDIHVRVAKYNKETNLYDELVLYKPGVEYHYDDEGNKIIDNPNFQKVYIYNGVRNYEMFDGMKDGDKNDGYGNFPWTSVRFNSLEPSFREEIEKYSHYEGCYDFYETNLADMKNYLNDHPFVTDYDADWMEYEQGKAPKPEKKNPIQYLYEEICNYISFANEDWGWIELLSAYKVIFFFDS